MRTNTCEPIYSKNGIAIKQDYKIAKISGIGITMLLIFSVLSLVFK